MEEKRKSIFTLFPNYESKFGNWYQEIEDKKNAEKDKKEEEKNKFNLIGDSKINGKANGYYFKIDGAFLGKEGQSNNIVICSDKKEYKEKDVFLYLSPIHTDFNISDIEEIAALIYAESSIQYINEISKLSFEFEAYALGTTIINYKLKRIHDEKIEKPYNPSYSQILTDMKAYGKGKPEYNNFKKTEASKRNGTYMQICIAASINALCYEFSKLGYNEFSSKDKLNFLPFDRSNNAILWDGVDIKDNYNKPHPKIKQGYFVSDKEHNVLDIESKKTTEDSENRKAVNGKVCLKLHSQKDPSFEETKCYEYTYKTTFGVAKTMFVKLTDQFEEAIVHSRREKKDGKYILSTWW